ncbi:MAG: hypothetical protein ACKOXB_12480 [Flavobacteriales bacterium]
MATTKYYPLIKDILPLQVIPSSFGDLKEQIGGALNEIFYKNYQIEYSSSGDTTSYNFDVVLINQLGFEIPGTGFSIV